ncbi:hypothetical protein Tco_1227196 [Tanacetum coccineum]
MVLAPGQPIPHGRPYCYHLNGLVHMMTARKRVRPLPTHRLVVRHSADYSSSDHFSSDDSSRDSSSSSSSETSSDSSADGLSDSASSRSSSYHSLPAPSSDHLMILLLRVLLARGVDPLLHLYRYLYLSLEHCFMRVLLLPSSKRIRSSEFVTDLEVSSAEGSELSRYKGTDLEMDDDVVRSDGIDIDPEIQAEIDECITYTDALRDRGIDTRVIVEAVDREEIETGVKGPIDRVTHPVVADDIPEPAQEGAVEVTYETLGDLVQRFHDHTEEILVHRVQAIESLKRDNMRLRDMMEVASQRVARSQRRELRVQREMRQIWHFRFYDRMRIARLEACARRHLGNRFPKMPNTRSGASMTREEFEELVTRRVAEEMEAREAARTLEPLNENGDELEGENGGNGNEGNRGNRNGGNGVNGNGGNGGNGNRNGNHGMNYGGFMPVARECTFQDFLKCKPHNFSGTEGVVGLTRWFEKMETVFNISNCPPKYQVKYATCTLQDSALTWWNSHKRTIGVEAAYAMNTDEVDDRSVLFQELILLCTRMVPDKEDRVERQGKVQGYAARSAENKRRMESNLRDNRGQQPPFKRQNTSGQKWDQDYTAGNNE